MKIKDGFCSEVSEQSDEHLAPASFAQFWVFHEKPMKEWPEKKVTNRDMPQLVLQAVRKLTQNKPSRFQFFCGLSQDTEFGGNKTFFFSKRRCLVGQEVNGEFKWEPYNEPIVFVCAHGKREPCCALRGKAFAVALAKRTEDVFLCTHTGGDRFAANALFFPSGNFFARLNKEQADRFPFNEDRKEFLQYYRGNVWIPPRIQLVQRELIRLGLSQYNFRIDSGLTDDLLKVIVVKAEDEEYAINMEVNRVKRKIKSDCFSALKTIDSPELKIIGMDSALEPLIQEAK